MKMIIIINTYIVFYTYATANYSHLHNCLLMGDKTSSTSSFGTSSRRCGKAFTQKLLTLIYF